MVSARDGQESRSGPNHSGPIRLGMVGGGEGAFIGQVHRIAARMDGHYLLVAGALSSTAEKSRNSGRALGLADDRIYPDFAPMAKAEAARPDGIEAVAIVTPNHLHAEAALAFLPAGIHVICDKPLTTNSADAQKMRAAAETSGLVFAVTHNYTGYPMVRQARAMISAGALGDIRLVDVEYIQDWLATPLEREGQKQAEWRTDPARSGPAGCLGDIGTHAYNLADFILGQPVTELAAELTTFVPGRQLDDNVQVRMRYANGAKGSLWASQVAVGIENGLRIRIYGSKGGLCWQQEHPNQLEFTPIGEPARRLSRGTGSVGTEAARVTRIPGAHPEGYLEAFATVYAEAAEAIRAHRTGAKAASEVHFPTIVDGVKGVLFIETCVRSSQAGGSWQKLPEIA